MDHIFNHIYPLPAASVEALQVHIQAQELKKGHILMQAGRLEKQVHFIQRGVVRAYTDTEKGEITFWFGEEGEAVLSMASYVMQVPSYESIELITDCSLLTIAVADLQRLYSQDIHLANWGRKLAEAELIKAERRMISRELLTATQRYAALVQNFPRLLQRVPLKHLASYLGVTQVSLSRIRKVASMA